MSVTTDTRATGAPATPAQVWDDPQANNAGTPGVTTSQEPQSPGAAAPVAPEDGSVTISGSDTGTRQPSGQTPDGKTITTGQLHDGDQATISRERTQADAGSGRTYVSSDQLVLTTKGGGDDKVEVTQRDDGTLDVNVNGESYEVRLAEGQEFGLRVGEGNDTVTVAANVRVNFVVDGGAGDDVITTGAGNDHVDGGIGNDTISGGAGRDDLFGNSGNDAIDGGSGVTVAYGGDGDDSLKADGDAEVNYFEGGAGNDTIDGSRGANIMSGGQGDDTLISGGSNKIYTGEGADTVTGATRADTVYSQTSVDEIRFAAGQSDNGQVVMNVLLDPKLGTTGIRVEGSAAFRQRVEADLEMLRNSPDGQQMLASFDSVASERGNTLTIREFTNEVNSVTYPDKPNATYPDIQITNGKAGPGTDVIIEYNASIDLDSAVGTEFRGFLPNVVLYHEMSHAYNMSHGTLLPGTYGGTGADAGGVPNSERQAVGLETTAAPFDFDNDPATPSLTSNPIALSENGLRREFGLPDRPSYAL